MFLLIFRGIHSVEGYRCRTHVKVHALFIHVLLVDVLLVHKLLVNVLPLHILLVHILLVHILPAHVPLVHLLLVHELLVHELPVHVSPAQVSLIITCSRFYQQLTPLSVGFQSNPKMRANRRKTSSCAAYTTAYKNGAFTNKLAFEQNSP